MRACRRSCSGFGWAGGLVAVLLAASAAALAAAAAAAPATPAPAAPTPAAPAPAPASAEKPIRVVCIGDSITQGRKGIENNPRWGPVYTYRYALWKKFIDAGAAVEFVGSRTTGFGGSPAYEPYKGKTFVNRHEGYWGWTTPEVSETLKATSAAWQADVAIVLLGTNDMAWSTDMAPTLKAMTEIVATLRKNNPRMVILLGEPFHGVDPYPALGKAYEQLAAKLSTADSPVAAVDFSEGWVNDPRKPGTHTVDGVHPNAAGDEKMAEQFFAALKPHLKVSAPAPAAAAHLSQGACLLSGV